MTCRARCLTALAAFHQVANEQTYVGAPRDTAALDRAYRELAAAMDALYGPVPAESELEFTRRSRPKANPI